MPPRDGDGTTPDEDELVAQIIPLRRRERDPEPEDSRFLPPPHDGAAAGDLRSPAERSVWDPPTTGLHRRESSRTASPFAAGNAETAGLPRRVVGVVLAALAVAGIAILVLSLGVFDGHSPGAAEHAGSLVAPSHAATQGTASATGRLPSKAPGRSTHSRAVTSGRGERAREHRRATHSAAHPGRATSAAKPAGSRTSTSALQTHTTVASSSTGASQAPASEGHEVTARESPGSSTPSRSGNSPSSSPAARSTPQDQHYGTLAKLWPAYDCSGATSFVLYAAGLMGPEALDSTGLESYGQPGPGRWITVYANSAHAWIVVAGIVLDTSDYGGPAIPAGSGPRWRSEPLANLADGTTYVARHPPGL